MIIIPERFDAVYVFGQVGKAGYYDYKEGKLHDFYINKAGGLASTAKDDDEIYIIKGVSREWISVEEDYKIEAGDFIYVLKEWPLNVWWYVGRVGAVASILGSIAAVVLLFK